MKNQYKKRKKKINFILHTPKLNRVCKLKSHARPLEDLRCDFNFMINCVCGFQLHSLYVVIVKISLYKLACIFERPHVV